MYPVDYVILGVLVLAALLYYLSRLPRVSGERPSHEQPGGVLGQAQAWLEEQGYAVLLIRPTGQVVMQADNRDYPHELQADFLVRRRGRQYIVIVKRGKQWDTRVTTRAAGQRLLEYQYAFGGRPILFFEPDSEKERMIRFHTPVVRRRLVLQAGFVVLLTVGLAVAWWLQ